MINPFRHPGHYHGLMLVLLLCTACLSQKNEDIPERYKSLKNLTVVPADAKPAHQIHFQQDATYGDTQNVVVGNISDLAVSSSGRVFIGNSNRATFFVYAPDGTFLSRLGKKGRGPGEFSRFWNPTVTNHTLYVYDPSLHRVSLFSTDSLALTRTLNLEAANQSKIKALRRYGMHYVYPWANGALLVNFSPNHIAKMDPDSLSEKYFLTNEQGNVISHQIFERKGVGAGLIATRFGGRYQGTGFNFAPRSLVALSDVNQIFSAWSADFLIKEYDRNGHYLQAFYYPFKKVSLSEDKALAMQKGRGSAEDTKYSQKVLRHAGIPKTWPALHGLEVDDQHRLWVATIRKDTTLYQWWVLDNQGKLLARFNWPRDKEIETIKGSHLYTRETDAKGVPRIVRYNIIIE